MSCHQIPFSVFFSTISRLIPGDKRATKRKSARTIPTYMYIRALLCIIQPTWRTRRPLARARRFIPRTLFHIPRIAVHMSRFRLIALFSNTLLTRFFHALFQKHRLRLVCARALSLAALCVHARNTYPHSEYVCVCVCVQ